MKKDTKYLLKFVLKFSLVVLILTIIANFVCNEILLLNNPQYQTIKIKSQIEQKTIACISASQIIYKY